MKSTKYTAKIPDAKGYVAYSKEENSVWQTLVQRQLPIIAERACDEYLAGTEILQLDPDNIPQLPDVNKILSKTTGWQVTQVAALISFNKFFTLLANRQFPAATFIRTREELEYLEEPDIFHELFGHCPMLTNQTYADFMQKYGELGVNANDKQQVMLARLYWFTVEFGLIKANNGTKIYGGGILSSINETPYSLESAHPERRTFDIMNILRTPYKINIMQPIYYIIDDYKTLYDLATPKLMQDIDKAIEFGLYPANYPKSAC